MSLFGALNSGVSGLGSQGSKIAIISDNISNVNTVGYKASAANFQTLVTNSATTTSYSPGGVLALTRQDIDRQGLIQGTGIVTDLAISGDGFFVVNSEADGTGDFVYTRAGSFRTDSLGNLVNASGFALFGWPLDSEGRIPGESGNLNTTSSALLASTQAVNINAISGVAAATSNVELGMNLDAGEAVLQGAGDTIDIVATSLENRDNDQDDIIIPNPSSGNTIVAGDGITVTASGQTFTYVFGGFATSLDITANQGGTPAIPGIFGATTTTTTFTELEDGDSFTLTTQSAGAVTFTFKPSAPSIVGGQFNTLETLAQAIDANSYFTARVDGGQLYIAPTDANEAMTMGTVGGVLSPAVATDLTVTTVLGANAANVDFSGGTNGDGVRIAIGNDYFDYTLDTVGAYVVGANSFGNLNELAAEINADFGAGTATIVGGVLTITDAALKYISNQNNVGTTDFATALGIRGVDFETGLGGTANSMDTIAASNRFATLGGLSELINDSTGVSATMENPLSDTSVSIYTDDPLGTIQFGNYNGGGGSDFLAEFGLSSTLFTAAYDPNLAANNMAGGVITPDFSRNIRFFDALGAGHDFQLSFVKIAPNTWAAELYAIDPDDITSSRSDGLVSSGTIVFNGDGSLRSVSTGLTTAIEIAWQNGAADSSVTLGFGTAGQPNGTVGATEIGLTDGLRQFNSDYNVEFVNQNGVSAGLLSSINIDENGFVVANFSNGESRNIFKVPLAVFANPNGLAALAGNVYRESNLSGDFNIRAAGESGTGNITPAAVETANVDLARELTEMIIAQRGYQASSKVITTVDDLLEELNRI